MDTPETPNDAESAQSLSPAESLSPAGIKAAQGVERVEPSEQSADAAGDSGSIKRALAAGLAGTVILAGTVTLLDRIDFRSNPPHSDAPEAQQTEIVEREPSQPSPAFYLPAEGEQPLQYHLPPSVIERAESPAPASQNAEVKSDQPILEEAAVVPLKSQRDLIYSGQPTQYGCVPTSVSMITDYWNQRDSANPTKSPQALLDLNAAQGQFDSAGMSASNIHDELAQMGYVAEDHVNADFVDLQNAVQDSPVLAIVKLGIRPTGVNHAVVVTGISGTGDVQINDPWTGKSHTYTKDEFVNSWGADFGKGAPTRSYVTIRPAPK